MRKLIERYIQAYNQKDVAGMISTLHNEFIFENYANGDLNASTVGVEHFKAMTEQSLDLFSTRTQHLIDYVEERDKVTVTIEFTGTFAVDVPNGINAGQQISLSGSTEFRFRDGLIVYLGVHTNF
jgi:ketosteroid isomerase-like protein